MKDTKEKNINDNSNNENLLYVGGNFLQSYLFGLFLSFSLFCKCLSVSLSLSSLWDLFLFPFPSRFLQKSGRCCISTKNKTFPFACLSVYFESDACH